jgi:SAM-dependent methyltransferase
MMFGTGDVFEYLECGRCGCLQLKGVPPDLSRYYPPNYYALAEALPASMGRAEAGVRRLRSEFILRGIPLLSRLARGGREDPAWLPWLKGRVTTRSLILDLGCGAGHFLLELRKQGFQKLVGADPFISSTIRYPNGVTVYKRLLEELHGAFDLIMLHHSFEHMPQPQAVRIGYSVFSNRVERSSCAFLLPNPSPGAGTARTGCSWMHRGTCSCTRR